MDVLGLKRLKEMLSEVDMEGMNVWMHIVQKGDFELICYIQENIKDHIHP